MPAIRMGECPAGATAFVVQVEFAHEADLGILTGVRERVIAKAGYARCGAFRAGNRVGWNKASAGRTSAGGSKRENQRLRLWLDALGGSRGGGARRGELARGEGKA